MGFQVYNNIPHNKLCAPVHVWQLVRVCVGLYSFGLIYVFGVYFWHEGLRIYLFVFVFSFQRVLREQSADVWFHFKV